MLRGIYPDCIILYQPLSTYLKLFIFPREHPWSVISLFTRRPTSPNVALQISKTYFAQINFCSADLETVLGIQWFERHARSHGVIPRALSDKQHSKMQQSHLINSHRIQKNPRHSTPVLVPCLPPFQLWGSLEKQTDVQANSCAVQPPVLRFTNKATLLKLSQQHGGADHRS